MYVNGLVALYSWIDLGCPNISAGALPSFYCGPPVFTTPSDGVLRLLEEVMDFCRPAGGSQEPLGGGRMRVSEELERCVKQHYASGPTGPVSPGMEWVDLEAIDLPTVAGQVPLESLLTPAQRAVYLDVDSFLLPDVPACEVPRPCHRVRPCDEDRLHRSLLDSGMAAIVEEQRLPKDPLGNPLVAGFSP